MLHLSSLKSRAHLEAPCRLTIERSRFSEIVVIVHRDCYVMSQKFSLKNFRYFIIFMLAAKLLRLDTSMSD